MNLITTISLWHDEAFSALLPGYGWQEMIYRIGLDVHPPLYYILLRVWNMFAGQSVLALRGFSIFFGILTVYAAYLFAKTAFRSKKLAVLAALLIAINPFQLQYVFEARMYTLGTFLALLSSYFLLRALEAESRSRTVKYWLWYGIAVAACLYTHYYLIFSVAAQGLYILFYFLRHRKLKVLIGSAGSYLLALFLFIPWIKIFFSQLGQVQGSFWIPPMEAWSIPGTIWKMFFGGFGASHTTAAIASVIALGLLLYFAKKASGPHKWYIVLALIVPFFAAVAVSFKTNLYLDRYFVFATLFFTIMIAAALYAVPKTIWRFLLIILLVGANLYANLKNSSDLDAKDKPGMAAAAEVINYEAGSDDKIYVASSFIYFTFKYYNQTGIAPLLISSLPLNEISHFSGTALLNETDLITDYEQTAKDNTVFMLWTTGFGGSKPKVPSNWTQINEDSFQDTPDFKGRIVVTQYSIN